MPDLFETIETTRAMRRLKPDPVPDELIAKILHAGVCAANGGNTQRWRFLVVKDREIKPVWKTSSFLVYTGGLTVLVGGLAAVGYLSTHYSGGGARTAWAFLMGTPLF